jgi:hypothetical protein
VLDVLFPWPELTPRQVENTLDGVQHLLWDGFSLNLPKYLQFMRAAPLKDVLGAVAAVEAGAGHAAYLEACGIAVRDAVEKQKKACNAIIPRLTAHFEGKLPPVLSPEETYRYKMVMDPGVFYGEFLKAEGSGGGGHMGGGGGSQ